MAVVVDVLNTISPGRLETRVDDKITGYYMPRERSICSDMSTLHVIGHYE